MLKKLLAWVVLATVTGLSMAAPADATLPALVRAASEGNAATVTALLVKGADPDARRADGRTALMEAANLGLYDIARDLLAHGAHKELQDNDGRNAFDFAILRQHSDLVALLRDAS